MGSRTKFLLNNLIYLPNKYRYPIILYINVENRQIRMKTNIYKLVSTLKTALQS